MNFTDELEIAGIKVKFEKYPLQHSDKITGRWYFESCCYTINVSTMYTDGLEPEPDERKLHIAVNKEERSIGSQIIPMTASKDRVLGVISKIISSYNYRQKELEEWAEEQSEEDYLF